MRQAAIPQDYADALLDQRDDALNKHANAMADLAAAEREIKRLAAHINTAEREIERLKGEVEKLTPPAPKKPVRSKGPKK
jgi:chromosome segregation ATPase